MNNRRDKIYDSITKKQIGILFAGGGLIGAVIFIICYGPSVLNVTNEGWLLKGSDLMQHYVGWKAYRQTPWQVPIGMTDGLVAPDQTCIIYTDSIPLLAIFFKLLSPILPETFQYFGLWGILSFILMGGIAAVILRKGTDKLYLCIIGSAFFSFSPYVLQRMYGHTALAGQWIILLAIMIWVYKPYFQSFKRKTIAWGLLLVVGSLVHIYYIPMVMIFMIFSCFQDVLENSGWKKDLLMGIIVIAADLLVLYCVGAFAVASVMDDSGLGKFSANLNTFWNPLGRGRALPIFPVNVGQDEGFGYLGAGILLLLVCVVLMAAGRRYWQRRQGDEADKGESSGSFFKDHSFGVSMILAFTAVMVLAVSPKITYNTRTLLVIPWPEKIETLLSIFRASGRFIWCGCYIIMIFVITAVIRRIHDQMIVTALLGAALLLQLNDLFPWAVSRKELTNSEAQIHMFASSRWEEVAEGKKHLQTLPFDVLLGSSGMDGVYAGADFAINHGMTTNYFISARVDYDRLEVNEQSVREALEQGDHPTDTLYILDSAATGKAYGMTVEKIDGITVGYFTEE